ncbi:unnamed protein product [Rotaria socialis]|uniref:protein-synthesizing GTPase n=1 Tax=Rotaria socialis TaxID=392032 RepID=A0A820MS22_9BILA|nr:unnamed protein product [Rotaria socialis]CAF3436538.1 unnamed protein product [Rotaria socialis]CAF4371453.1 unnamed protein product [Rotaria socialis]CAF4378156.1 unnamed protein product [Rotaria socialis]
MAKQSIANLNLNLLTPLTPEIMSRQATINIGTIGHVAHGKSTVVKCLSGIDTGKFGREKQQNRTIHLGYANAKIFECDNAECPRPQRYRATGSNASDQFPCDRPGCVGQFHLLRHISFVDCPGHETFMAAMLNGAAIMDAALMVIAANEFCPQPQTYEHLAAVNIMNLKSILILQNKIDLVGQVKAEEQCEQIKSFIKDTNAKYAPIIPISAQLNCNMDSVCDFIVRKIPIPIRDFTSKPKMTIIRSFDVNKPGTDADDLKGGIAGGSIIQGVLKVNQTIEIRPGLIFKDNTGQLQCSPIKSKIISLYAEKNTLEFAVPGGLIGVGTKIDPTLTRADRLVGQVLGEAGSLSRIYIEITAKYSLLKRVVGVQSDSSNRSTKINKLSENEVLLINIGSLSTGGRVLRVKSDLVKIQLTKPVCADINEKLALSRRIDGHSRLIGWGEIQTGKEIEPQMDM